MALPAVLISSSVSIVLVPLVIRISRRNGWYDESNERKIHKGQIPRLGGIGIFCGFAAGVIATVLWYRAEGMSVARLMASAGGVSLVFIIGLVDDFRNIPALWKAVGQVLAAFIVVAGGNVVTHVYMPFLWQSVPLGPFAYPITVLWLVGLSNALNLVDGMDGLAGGVAVFAAAAFAVIGIVSGNPILTAVALALFGSALGFLVFNLPPASVFMGDSGSLVLGFVLALLPLLQGSPDLGRTTLIGPMTILFIPILDTAAAIIRRLMRGEPIHAPDREHLHHKVLDLGLTTTQALMVIYGATAVLGAVAVAYHFIPVRITITVFLLVCVSGAVAMGFLAARHARLVAVQRTGLRLKDRFSRREIGRTAEAHGVDRAAR